MNAILDPVRLESFTDSHGTATIGLENAKMLLELAKAERSFSLFLEFLDDKEKAEKFAKKFEALRDECVIESVRKTMAYHE